MSNTAAHEDHTTEFKDSQSVAEIDPKNKSLFIQKSNEFYINDLNFMPVYEIKSLNSLNDSKFDIFADIPDSLNDLTGVENTWDASLRIDYNKLRKYI